MDKLTKKLQVLLSEDEVTSINRIILNDAIETSERPVSISAFIREIVRKEIDLRADSIKEWNKDNIKKLENVLDVAKQIEGVTFVWDDEHFKIKNNPSIAAPSAFKGESIGVIAQQVEEVIPNLVFTDKDGYKSVQYDLMVTLGVGSVKEQQLRIDSIINRINNLKDKISG